MLTLYKNIKRLREEKGLSQDALAKLTGYTDRSSIAKIERGLVDLPQSKILLFAKALGESPSDLMGTDSTNEDLCKPATGIKIKVLGNVAAGIPIEAIENVIDVEEIPEELAKTGDFFGLRIKGDSMTPSICDGDTVIVKQQSDAESNDIVIATINGDEAVCKRLRKYRDGIELISINPSYAPLEFSNEQIAGLPVRIIGKVIELRRKM